jgi:subtilisin family serine protease
MFRRFFAAGLCLLLLFPTASIPKRTGPRTSDALRSFYFPFTGQRLSVIVHLVDHFDSTDALYPYEQWPASAISREQRLQATISQLRRNAEIAQAPLRAWLRSREVEGRAENVTAYWIFNGLALTAPPEVILQIAARPDVTRISLDEVILAPPPHNSITHTLSAQDNLSLIGAPEAWARGFTGQGVVVALLDSGVDMTHPQLAARWRGGSNSWFDPNGEHPDAPFDVNGHGTQTLGVILGDDADGSHIGVAPEAQWIAAKIFNDRDRATTSGIHQALQWVLDPDGNPATPDTPHVLNNSWSFVNARCDPEFADDLRALRAAGTLPVFAAGVRDSVSPANTPEAFAVGALAGADLLSADSPRGPSACSEVTIFPHLVAPGANILTTDRFGLYNRFEGTSLAAAHVSGALALLLSADPSLSAEAQEKLLIETAVDLGEPGPDSKFGYGRLNVAAALERVLGPDPAARATMGAVAASASPVAQDAPSQDAQTFPAIVMAGLAGGLLILLVGLRIVRAVRRAR